MKQERLSPLTLEAADRVIDETGEQQHRHLPDDCILLSLFDGLLLVSRPYALFCRIPASDRTPLRALINYVLRNDLAPMPTPDPTLAPNLDLFGIKREPVDQILNQLIEGFAIRRAAHQ